MEDKYCSTEEMIADLYYTKLLQGKHYYNLRQLIIGPSAMTAEERVEKDAEMATVKSTVRTNQ